MPPSRLRQVLGSRSLRVLACLPGLLCLLVTGLPSAPVAAATQKEVQAQIDKLGAEISDLDEHYNQASIHLQKVQSQIQDSRNQGTEFLQPIGACDDHKNGNARRRDVLLERNVLVDCEEPSKPSASISLRSSALRLLDHPRSTTVLTSCPASSPHDDGSPCFLDIVAQRR